jgi:DHA2 family multidrug resistance protein
MVLAPRGVGTMISMILVGRLVQRVDARILIFCGLSITAFSLYQMTGFSPQMDKTLIVVSGIVQGLGLGLVFVPLSTLAFATLEPRYRTDAASLFSLIRNIGSSIGISIVTVMLAHNLQVNRTELVSFLTPFNQNFDQLPHLGSDQTMLAILDNEVTRQSLIVGYVDDFRLMMLITLSVLPLVFLLRRSAKRPSLAEPAAAVAD